MEWKSLFIGLIIGALIAVPLGMAHSGGFDMEEKTGSQWSFGPMGGYGMHSMMGYGMHGMMDEDMHEEMEEHMDDGNFTEIHEEMEEEMEEHMGNWAEMHEYCEQIMGIDND